LNIIRIGTSGSLQRRYSVNSFVIQNLVGWHASLLFDWRSF
jgi:purine-nucleoside phosphorylase